MKLNRRAFFQQTMLALAALGVSEAGLSVLVDRYQQALAQPTRRKLALLVGINQYPEQVCDCVPLRGAALNGCLTDVELQRQLLIHRFGFQPADVLTLTDQQATRQGIESAFFSHLTEQARPGDIVVFHFSGLGSQVRLSNAQNNAQSGDESDVQYSLVPVDGVLPTEDKPTVNDFLLETLGLLLRSLQTEQITTVLDVSYSAPSRLLQGGLRMRSRPNTPIGQRSESASAFQERLLSQVKATRSQVKAQWRSGQLPGTVLSAANLNQAAAEGNWNGFSAGLFTYSLTQQLWWAMPDTTLRTVLSRSVSKIEQQLGSNQEPQLNGQKSQNQALLPYYLAPSPVNGADGVVKSVEDDGKVAQLWLGGLPAHVLEYYSPSSLFSLYGAGLVQVAPVSPAAAAQTPPSADTAMASEPTADAVPASGESTPTSPPTSPADRVLQIRSREGLLIKARLCCGDGAAAMPIRVGQFLQESVRVLPRNIGLTVALDASLERIERVDATSAFAAISRVSSVVAGEQPADCLFGKMQPSQNILATSLTNEGSAEAGDFPLSPSRDLSLPRSGYGLFHLGRAAIPNTLSEEDEAVKTAVNRVTPQLHTLLATKLLRLTENSGSSRLGVRATLEMVAPQERIVMQQETSRSPWPLPEGRLAALFVGSGDVPTLPISSRIQYRLHNYSDRPIYFILLGIDSSGNAVALYPTPANMSIDSAAAKLTPSDSVVPPGEIITVPQPMAASEWIVRGPLGSAETHLIFSRAPLEHTFTALEGAMRSINNARRVSLLSKPLDVAQAVLKDLHQASVAGAKRLDAPPDTYALDVNAWATLSFAYRISEA